MKGILHTTFAVCAALAEKLENHLHISFKEEPFIQHYYLVPARYYYKTALLNQH